MRMDKNFDFRIWDTKNSVWFDKGESTNFCRFLELGRLETQKVLARKDMPTPKDLEIELWSGYFDINGIKIFDKDIIAGVDMFGRKIKGVVINSVFHWNVEQDDGSTVRFCDMLSRHVVGNIHETERLLIAN
ncbi:hypothetical protein CQA49_06690 [Helicobacter sp. MIT 00-7814]|uniref:YopX family protein n=1 Tax=unclassified Helicobacter TaxID=2593540 RepID=UPI000E1F85FF|nr:MULTISPECIES: YopX family protein [unclassified Helicobacter]RDU53330.1 hypothetical protein CQA49_06690 [Helicobacter sp. MIT 00-7814]RDU54151.1 hypothetical protein CQA37_05930 [Helicobacter sp. MIT 99-10781]